MIGVAHPAGTKDGLRRDIDSIARYFSIPEEKIIRVATEIEESERPQIVLLQRADREGRIFAAALYSSVWSKSYGRVGHAYGKVHRDFHYQVLFSALTALIEVGCEKLRIENPMSGYPWREDAYVCLLEATGNLRAHFGRRVSVFLEEGGYDPRLPLRVEANVAKYRFEAHRPIGIHLHIVDGLNVRDVFVERIQGNNPNVS